LQPGKSTYCGWTRYDVPHSDAKLEPVILKGERLTPVWVVRQYLRHSMARQAVPSLTGRMGEPRCYPMETDYEDLCLLVKGIQERTWDLIWLLEFGYKSSQWEARVIRDADTPLIIYSQRANSLEAVDIAHKLGLNTRNASRALKEAYGIVQQNIERYYENKANWLESNR
jgi:hypothetical protein